MYVSLLPLGSLLTSASKGDHPAVSHIWSTVEGTSRRRYITSCCPLPDSYPLPQTLHSRNHLDWMRELETRLKMKNVNNNIMSIAIAKNVLLENIMELADREVDGTQTCGYHPSPPRL